MYFNSLKKAAVLLLIILLLVIGRRLLFQPNFSASLIGNKGLFLVSLLGIWLALSFLFGSLYYLYRRNQK
ncbi:MULTISPECIES: hypothetical protein [Enterococcus]|uniref:DUF3955 domain-containing protein n=1 Tax=Enterococcus alishanensis TaxID=1303817 RepID=A0ABS6TFW5_9ENTE|nr:hypothetical protein [Enterococcus alishanensis]MBV7391799.1 hypothetical protein [Enterococcus alishanensis]